MINTYGTHSHAMHGTLDRDCHPGQAHLHESSVCEEERRVKAHNNNAGRDQRVAVHLPS
jgi:hypothetical protein